MTTGDGMSMVVGIGMGMGMAAGIVAGVCVYVCVGCGASEDTKPIGRVWSLGLSPGG